MTAISRIAQILNRCVDASTFAAKIISYPHAEIHEGNGFFVSYSVPSLGAMTSPDDMVTLTFTTPDTVRWPHFRFYGQGTGGWRVRMIEAPTGGGATQTEQLEVFNNDRNCSIVSTVIALDSTPGEVSYDATLATGGKTLLDEYIPGGGGPFSSVSLSGTREEIILKQNTKYQVSVYGTDADPATLKLTWYEHENED